MADSNQNDIVTEILQKTIDEYEMASKDHKESAKALKLGIEKKNLMDPQWVLDTLGSDLS